LSELEQLPWSFSYEFRCDDERCTKPHTLKIIDWELGAAYRRWARSYGDRWEEALREKFERELPASDLHLVVGNIAIHPRNFVIIGLLRPPRPKMADGRFVQETLDLMGEERTVAGVGVGLEAEQADALGTHEGEEPLELFPDEALSLAIAVRKADPVLGRNRPERLRCAQGGRWQVANPGRLESGHERARPELRPAARRRVPSVDQDRHLGRHQGFDQVFEARTLVSDREHGRGHREECSSQASHVDRHTRIRTS
jgi:hypothetical protein